LALQVAARAVRDRHRARQNRRRIGAQGAGAAGAQLLHAAAVRGGARPDHVPRRLRRPPQCLAAPRPRRRARRILKPIPAPMTLLMLAIFTAMVGVASTYPPAARFMPYTVGIPAIALCLLQLALDVYRRRQPGEESADALKQAEDQVARIAGRRVQFDMPSDSALFTDGPHDERERVRREIIVWSYFLGLIAGILLFGFQVAIPIFLITFLRYQADASWRNAILYGGIGALAMYVVFEKVL